MFRYLPQQYLQPCQSFSKTILTEHYRLHLIQNLQNHAMDCHFHTLCYEATCYIPSLHLDRKTHLDPRAAFRHRVQKHQIHILKPALRSMNQVQGQDAPYLLRLRACVSCRQENSPFPLCADDRPLLIHQPSTECHSSLLRGNAHNALCMCSSLKTHKSGTEYRPA